MQQVHDLALSMPGVTVESAGKNPVYQVGRKSFVFFRNPRPDAFDPETGERYDDVIVFWVAEEPTSRRWSRTTSRRSSPPRTSTATRRCCCAAAGSAS